MRRILVVLLLSGVLAAAGARIAHSAATSLTMVSDSADFVGQGRTYVFGTDVGTFYPSAYANGNIVGVTMIASTLGEGWSATFAGAGGAALAAGNDLDAVAYPNQDATHPGMAVSGDGRGCDRLSGAFQIKQITIESGVLTQLWVRFDQHCYLVDPALVGELRYNADTSFMVTAPIRRRVLTGQPVSFDVDAHAVAGGTASLSASGVPDGAAFTDHGDGTGTFTWTPSGAQVGTIAVTFTGTFAGGQDHSTTFIEVAEPLPTGETSLAVDSDPGDYIGQGQHVRYAAGDGTFTGFRYNGGAAAAMGFRNAQHNWDLVFGAPGAAALTPGWYRDAERYPNFTSLPGLSISSDGRGCNMLNGAFEIKQVVMTPSGVGRLWVRFVQHCERGEPALTGELRFNADVTLALVAPIERRVQAGASLDVPVTATDTTGAHVTLTTDALPAGATFEDHGDGTGALHWAPTVDQIGDYTMVFRADDGAGHQDHATMIVHVRGANALEIDDERGGTGGVSGLFTAGSFRASQSFYDNSVEFTYVTPAQYPQWDIILAAASNDTLRVGTYENVLEYNYGAPPQPRLGVRGPTSGCSPAGGRFVVREIAYGANQAVTALWATFETPCDGREGVLRGELRYNAHVVTDITAPRADTAGIGQTVTFGVTSVNAYGRHVALTARGVPAAASFVDHGDGTGTFTWTPGLDDVGRIRLTFVGDDGAGNLDSALTHVMVQGETSLRIESDPNHPTDGPQLFTSSDGVFSGSRHPQDNSIGVGFTQAGAYQGWGFQFAVPRYAPVDTGLYAGATPLQLTGFAVPAPTYPVLEIQSPSFVTYDCLGLSIGLFQVKQIAYGADSSLRSFWATFERTCTGRSPDLVGEIRYNAAVVVDVHAPLQASVDPGRLLELAVRATDRDGSHVTLSAAGLPPGAAFVDHGDGTGTFTWTPSATDIGLHDVRFTGADAAGHDDHAITHVRVHGRMRLITDSAPGDGVGNGQSEFDGSEDGQFTAWKNYREGVSFIFQGTSTYVLPWDIDMTAPGSALLAPGDYAPVYYFPYGPADQAGLAVRRGYDVCTSISGAFHVRDIVYGPGAEIAALRATFEQTCAGATGGVTGELWWNFDPPVWVDAPVRVDTVALVPLHIDVRGVARSSEILSLSATGLPAGASFTDHRDNTGTLDWTPSAQQAGDHVVTFHVASASGEGDSTRTRVVIHYEDRPPIPAITFPSPLLAGVPATFDASRSTDPDGDTLQFVWVFTDTLSFHTGVRVVHTFRNAGSYHVFMQASDGQREAYVDSLVQVHDLLEARVFVEGGDRVVRLGSGRPECVRIEPVTGDFRLADVLPGTIEMRSRGTGGVDSVLARAATIDRDTDHNGIPELEACFSKSDLVRLFSALTARGTQHVTVRGRLASGDEFSAGLDIDVVPANGPLQLAWASLPDGHGYRMSFEAARPGTVEIRWFDVSGRSLGRTRTWVEAGAQQFQVDAGTIGAGSRPGVYFYRVTTPDGEARGRLVLLQ